MRRLLLVLSAVALAASLLSASAAAGGSERGAAPKAPRVDRPGYEGLRVGGPGSPCKGLFEMRHEGRFLGCTHGPDPFPAGGTRIATVAAPGRAVAAGTGGIACIGNGRSGNRVQAIYAHLNGTPNRLVSLKDEIKMYAAQTSDVFNASAADTNGSKQIRWVTTNCQLDIDVARLPTSTRSNFPATVGELHDLGFDDPSRKYLVWFDVKRVGPGSSGICGIGQKFDDDRPGQENLNNSGPATGAPDGVPGMVARVDGPPDDPQGCWGLLTRPSAQLSPQPVEAHELNHAMGGVQDTAPNSTPIGHCVHEWDAMCYDDDFNPGTFPLQYAAACPVTRERLMDCGHNDYFRAPSPSSGYLKTHWNTATNSFLVSNVAPGNDRMANAQPLPASPGAYAGSNRLAGKETGEPAAGGSAAARSVWYTIKTAGGRTLTIDTVGSKLDTVLGIYTGTAVGGLTEVDSDDNSAGAGDSRVSIPTQANKVYRIKVDGKGGASGMFLLHVSYGTSTPIILDFNPKSGPPGTDVTITGQDLLVCPPFPDPCDLNGLTFNGTPFEEFGAPISDPTPDEIVVKVPDDATDGPITLSVDRGYVVSSASFNVT